MPPRSLSKIPSSLERRLVDSSFRVIGPPAPLDMNPAVVAMQALGPAGELFYFTRIPPGKSKFDLGSAQSFVDRVFIVVLGVHDIRRTLDFYSQTFGLPVTEPAPSRVAVLAQAWGHARGPDISAGDRAASGALPDRGRRVSRRGRTRVARRELDCLAAWPWSAFRFPRSSRSCRSCLPRRAGSTTCPTRVAVSA